MDFNSITEVLEETIAQIKEQISVEESPLVSQLQLLRDLTRRKLLNNDTPETDFSHKISLMLEKKKMLEDKLEELQERAKKELQFKTDIIERNHALIVERKKQHEEILAAERAMYEQQITLAENAFQIRKEREYKSKIENTRKLLDENRKTNVAVERIRRQKWIQKKDELQEILDEYDTKMIELQNKLEYLSGLHEHEKRELERYKELCEKQDEPYHALMQEKEEYLESVRQKKLYEIRVKIARRTIVKFIEQYYPIWKKKKLKATKKKSKYRSWYGK